MMKNKQQQAAFNNTPTIAAATAAENSEQRKGSVAVIGRLVYGSTGSAIPDACSRLANRSGHV
ncbi:hypothetical protein T11_117 [Trichinella zimbabwensis]|uniref:Uncharacterized protein n=1 Tax=Trichinella zimbabwensis TaxID=268475 RepID=A0A0V1H3A7_9BILA|nr:hypothetical protein T11_117 [Trichinella zimbabwensis]